MAQSQKSDREKSSQPINDSTEQTTNQLVTFETYVDEGLIVMAGRGEMDNRTIFSGSTSGRYATVPMDKLEYDHPDDAEELDIGDLS